jgi:branched-chain amino acid transport system permease protein
VVSIFNGRAGYLDIATIGLAIILAVGIHFFMRLTPIGLACLAASQDREAAMLKRINVRRYSLWAFGISGLIGGLMGPLLAANSSASVTNALNLAVEAFIVLTIGGVGSQIGALWGGFAIGLLEAFITFRFGTQYSDASVYVVFLAVLLLRPHGLFGHRQARTV